MQVWMLTGDKLETAENIAKSCQLIQPDNFKVIKFNETNTINPDLYKSTQADNTTVDQITA